MSDGNGPSCLAIIGSIVGILSGLLTIVAYFFSDADSLLEAVGDFIPVAAESFGGAARAIDAFADAWPVGPWLSAFFVFGLVIGLRFLAETVFDLATIEVTPLGVIGQILAFLPLALLWVWVFSGVASGFAIFAFLVGYLVSIVGSIILASELG